MNHWIYALATAGLAQSSPDAALLPAGLVYAFVSTTILFVAASLGLFAWVRSVRRELTDLHAAHDKLSENVREVGEDREHLRKELEEKRRSEQELKRDLAAQKKKNFTAQEEIRSQQAKNEEQRRERDALLLQKPAFAPAEHEPSHAKVKPAPAPAPAPAPVAQAPSQSPAAAAERAALESRLESIETEMREARTRWDSERKKLQVDRDELKHAREHADKLRRIDIISKNKIELLEDKLGAVQRAHYEAVSELAVLKGEVAPVPPRDARRPRPERDHADRMAAGGGAETALDQKTEQAAQDEASNDAPASDQSTP